MRILIGNLLTVFCLLLAFTSEGVAQWLLFVLSCFGIAHMILALAKEISETVDADCNTKGSNDERIT